MDVVRAFYRAVNASDAESVAAFYHPDCILEYVFADGRSVCEGRDAARQRWLAEFDQYAGGLPGGHRIRVDRVAGMETGWGWVRADWTGAIRDRTSGDSREAQGYSHFWIDGGLISRHRSIVRTPGVDPGNKHPGSTPGVGVGAVIFVGGRVVLVRRRHEPLAGQWSLPGGRLERGETLEAGVAREVLEETGLVVEVGPLVEVFDRILVDEAGSVRYHFVLVDYLCRPLGGTLQAGGDIDEVALADPAALDSFRVAAKARDVIARALRVTP
jgi:ADP-ribose pyrophosphatase YjhB (NUDIX family)